MNAMNTATPIIQLKVSSTNTNGCYNCCSVLQCVALSCIELQCVAVCCRVLPCRRVLQCVAVCCSLFWRVAVCCSVLLTSDVHEYHEYGMNTAMSMNTATPLIQLKVSATNLNGIHTHVMYPKFPPYSQTYHTQE